MVIEASPLDANDLIAKNKGLVYKQLHSYYLINDPEAVSLGFEALLNAIETYDRSKSVKLSTYATVCINNALGNYIRRMKKKRQLDIVYYNDLIEGQDIEYIEILPSDINVENEIIFKEYTVSIQTAINKLYGRVKSEKQKKIIRAWVNSDFSFSTIQLAEIAGVSQSYVCQVLSCFRHKLKNELGDYNG